MGEARSFLLRQQATSSVSGDITTHVLTRTMLSGFLRRGEASFLVEFHVAAGSDCRLQVDVEPISTEMALALYTAMGEPGSSSERLTLMGIARPEQGSIRSMFRSAVSILDLTIAQFG
ncbi:hypothetical protein XH94_30565 [Bradyrhizobium zhanjiangense]|uniref:Uncharacterized protein n=1 Tax=Bradyrhizobium zhanjiangense TaxID=1325107 RepID=A0A4V1L2Q1_9BRAD|nr:hypothetical protein XH94_30565 [Bradyrhizobium zhanjiangense]